MNESSVENLRALAEKIVSEAKEHMAKPIVVKNDTRFKKWFREQKWSPTLLFYQFWVGVWIKSWFSGHFRSTTKHVLQFRLRTKRAGLLLF
jgi:hypothetical protein